MGDIIEVESLDMRLGLSMKLNLAKTSLNYVEIRFFNKMGKLVNIHFKFIALFINIYYLSRFINISFYYTFSMFKGFL